MTKWRPAGWKEQQEAAHANHVRKGYAGVDLLNYDRGFEAGADALLDALRKNQKCVCVPKDFHGYLTGTGVGEDIGALVYIPDEPREEHGHRP